MTLVLLGDIANFARRRGSRDKAPRKKRIHPRTKGDYAKLLAVGALPFVATVAGGVGVQRGLAKTLSPALARAGLGAMPRQALVLGGGILGGAAAGGATKMATDRIQKNMFPGYYKKWEKYSQKKYKGYKSKKRSRLSPATNALILSSGIQIGRAGLTGKVY